MNRTATAVFGLIYPAVLGALLFGLIQNPVGRQSSSLLAVVLILYFVLQFVQGSTAASFAASRTEGQEHRGYLWGDALADLAEVATMLLAFAVLGFFGDPADVKAPQAAILALVPNWLFATETGRGAAIAAVFAVPPLVRTVDGLGARRGWWQAASTTARPSHAPNAHCFLAAMSALAALGGFLQPSLGNWTLILIAVPLLAYWVLFLREVRPQQP